MHITRSDDVPSVASPHGELVYELIGETASDGSTHSLAQIVIAPGRASRKHYHPGHEESYYILAGRGTILMGEERQPVRAGDAILIPANTVHQIENTGTSDESLIFLAVCVPPWTPDCSVYLD